MLDFSKTLLIHIIEPSRTNNFATRELGRQKGQDRQNLQITWQKTYRKGGRTFAYKKKKKNEKQRS
jgi:hypothetical protein